MTSVTNKDRAAATPSSLSGGEGVLHVDQDRIDPRRLIAFLAMCVGMFMAFLDIQIVSASLSEIQAGLSASADEINWVQTSYLIAEVISIPLSGYLSRALGTRMMFTISAAGFTFASLMCGFTNSMNEMIFWRAIQGFIGGGMIPTVFASTYLIFPRSKMPVIIPLIGLIATLAPTIGPTIGGYLTEALSWHWLFFINIIPGIAVSLAAFALIDFDRPDYSLFDNFDWTGLITMAMFLGALEYVLEEGPRNDWFEDGTIVVFAMVSAVGAVGFFWRALTTRNPIVDLLAFANRNFALGSMFSFVLGVGLYGLTYLYPLYLARVRGYDALMIGETMFVSGAAMFLSAPLGRPADEQDRSAFDAAIRVCDVRRGIVDDDLRHQGFRLLGTIRSASPARHRSDVLDGSGHEPGARDAAAGAVEKCVRPVQPDAQSWGRGRSCPAQYTVERPDGPPSRTPA